MPEFDDARNEYNQARDKALQTQTALIRSREDAKRHEREVNTLQRQVNANANNGAGAKLRAAERNLADARSKAGAHAAILKEASAARNAALTRFAVFTDPTEAVGRLSDDTPIALFPLRLETRFKTVRADNREQQELWVRVYPDDALVDTFQPEISETELANVSTYWTNRWRAGGSEAGHRAAWAPLVRSHGAGRAKWLIDQYAPNNPGDEPAAGVNDHILVVRTTSPIAPPEQPAIAAFWERVWATAGVERDAAYTDLESAVGAARAVEIETELAPVNLLDAGARPDGTLAPVVVFLELPDPSTLPISVDDWTRGAKTTLLPERLVLLGFQGGTEVLRETGAPIPAELQVGPDPAAPDDEQLQADGEDISFPDPMHWTVDFDAAVAQGMAFRVNLSGRNIAPEFDRLLVLGVRVGSDAEQGKSELGELIVHHQSSRKGFEILPQGRPSNNTDASNSAYTWWVDPEESFEHFFMSDAADDPTDWRARKDGAWLAGLLGVDPAVLRESPNYYGTDQAEARAMNVALWPATLGYYMEQMMEPVFSERTVRRTRDFFNRFVTGRGSLPLVRIGRQPYGVLPATVWSQTAWWRRRKDHDVNTTAHGLPVASYFDELNALVQRGVSVWTSLSRRAGRVGDPGADAQQTLLDILGLHPSSAEFYQRYSQSFTQYYNALGFATEPVSEPLTAAAHRWIEAGLLALSEFGWQRSPEGELPELLEKIFHKQAALLKGILVSAELSENEPLGVDRADGQNYISWLQRAARTSHDALRKQEGFADGPPTALLYLMLRHALDLGFVDTGLQLRRNALEWNDTAYLAARREPKFIHVDDTSNAVSESRWEPLYRAEPSVTGDAALRLGDFIPSILAVRNPYLNQQLQAFDTLKNASTAALERAFVEHIDCLSYRLDAWRLGMQSAQLSYMRAESEEGYAKDGIYIGAYGWLEDVKPREGVLSSVELDDTLAPIFDAPELPPLMRESDNFGHIHGPSLDHAATAAILRNGHLANAMPDEPDMLAVDLSSERVRLAQYATEGIRNGQSLGALLGYQLERALHDEPDLFLDRLIYDLRRAFPLAGNRLQGTRVSSLDSITAVEARNVVDGAALMEHIAETNETRYPYGLTDLPPLSEFTGPGLPSASQIGILIDGHVAKMRSVGDAVGDLSIAESVYQVVRGNYERAGGALDAFSKGTHPPEPEVIATPRGGKTLTSRVSLHFEGGLLPADPANTTPRAKCEPAIAKWLVGQMPAPASVFARITYHDEPSATDVSLTPSMADLGLAPVDLFYLVDAGGARDMPGFDDLMIDFAIQNGAPAPRDDAVFSIEYKPAGAAGPTLFELAPLIRALRGTLLGARPLRPTDLSLQNEASETEDGVLRARSDKPAAVVAELQLTLPPIDAFVTAVDAATAEGIDAELARDLARDNIDQWIDDYAAILRPILPFGLQAASLTAATEGRRAPFTAMRAALDELIERWEAKQDEYDLVMQDYDDLPAAATDEDRTPLLIRAGRIVSTTVIAPLPPLISGLEADVQALRDDLDTALGELRALRSGVNRSGTMLASLTALLPTIARTDQTPFEVGNFRDSVFALAGELQQKAVFLRDDVSRRIVKANDALVTAAASVGDKAQSAVSDAAHALLGNAFVVLPEFTLAPARLAEWDSAWSSRTDLLTHLKTGANPTPYPVEDWLHGIARVRERMRFLEMTDLLGDALGAASEPTLEALQFPHRPHDVWLGLSFPDVFGNGDPFVLDEDKLLYNAVFDAGAEIDLAAPGKTYSGLMLDEWVEVIPTEKETTGLAFHYNRPNSEAPQAILLATPPVFRGSWRWEDLVATLHETLDFAELRAVEPAHLDGTALGPLLPAVLSSVTTYPITAMLNFSFNNQVHAVLQNSG